MTTNNNSSADIHSNDILTSIPNATPQTPLGIIGGSSFLESSYISSFNTTYIDTPFECSSVRVYHNNDKSIYFIQRHGSHNKYEYCPPNLIPYKSIIYALYKCNVRHIIGFGSVGSLKYEIPVGTLLTPDDYYMPYQNITFFDYSIRGHLVPAIDDTLRSYIHSILDKGNITYKSTGVYTQTIGPRFETKTEIKALATYADVVGMTCVYEAILTRELGINYALICMCDNYANGIAKHTLTTDEFHAGVKRNLNTMENVLGCIIKHATNNNNDKL